MEKLSKKEHLGTLINYEGNLGVMLIPQYDEGIEEAVWVDFSNLLITKNRIHQQNIVPVLDYCSLKIKVTLI